MLCQRLDLLRAGSTLTCTDRFQDGMLVPAFTGLINGAERIEAAVAAAKPGSPSPTTKEYPSRNPNFGIRFNSTPAPAPGANASQFTWKKGQACAASVHNRLRCKARLNKTLRTLLERACSCAVVQEERGEREYSPIMRGQRPEREAEIGEVLNTALASAMASLGLTATPCAFFANCCTSCRYAVTGLSPTVWMADPPRYAQRF